MEYKCPNSLLGHRLVCLDIETTGLDIIRNNIIELGVVEVKQGRITQQYSKIFGGGRSSIYLVRKVHGIKDAEREGKATFKECCKKISDYLSGAVIVTHNGAKFDIPFMERNMREVGVSLSYMRHIDTYLLSRKFENEKNSLEWLCNHYGIKYDESNHRGLADCLCTLQVLYAFCDEYGENIILN